MLNLKHRKDTKLFPIYLVGKKFINGVAHALISSNVFFASNNIENLNSVNQLLVTIFNTSRQTFYN